MFFFKSSCFFLVNSSRLLLNPFHTNNQFWSKAEDRNSFTVLKVIRTNNSTASEAAKATTCHNTGCCCYSYNGRTETQTHIAMNSVVTFGPWRAPEGPLKATNNLNSVTTQPSCHNLNQQTGNISQQDPFYCEILTESKFFTWYHI